MAQERRAQRGVRSTPLVPFADGDTGLVDPCAVETERLAEVLREAASSRNGLGRGEGGEEMSTPQLAVRLAAKTRELDPRARGVPARTVNNVLRGVHRTTELRTADALLAAVGRFDALYNDPRLEPAPNRAAGARGRALCCGGLSLTGAITPAA